MYKNIMRKKIQNYSNENNIEDIDYGFLRYVNEQFYDAGIEELDYSIIEDNIVDGNCDKQIDLIQIEGENIITIRIIQVKNKGGFESNIIILLKNGLDWIFNKEEEEVNNLKNSSFKNKILEVRDIISKKRLSEIFLDVSYVTLGKKEDIREGDEIEAEIRSLTELYKAKFPNFSFELYGAQDLYNYVESKAEKAIDIELSIIYDKNVASLIENEHKNIKSIVCNIKASELIKIFKEEKSKYLFDLNVRKYLDDRSKVNKGIIETATGDDSEYFWALNNGVTIICDKYEIKTVGGFAELHIEGLQIINGCQTTMALYNAKEELKDNTTLLLRVHEIKERDVIDKIILSTNNQNPINPRDLVSNTKTQLDLERYFHEMYSVYYQRKRNDLIDLDGRTIQKKEVVSNDKVGQAALACIKSIPYLALGSRGKVFGDHIDIFDKNKDEIALAFFLYKKVIEYPKSNMFKNDVEANEIIKFARYHITGTLFAMYKIDASVEFNKKILHNDKSINEDLELIVTQAKSKLLEEAKQNMLKFFKTKESNIIFNEIKNNMITNDKELTLSLV